MTEYYTLYDNAVDAITAVMPNAFVGGPATTEPGKIAAFLQHCKTANKRVTFASSHVYPGGAAAGTSANANGLLNDNNTRVSQITSGGYTTTAVKSFNTEWNSSYNGQGGLTGDVVIEHGQPLERGVHPQGHQAALRQELGRHAAARRVFVLGAVGRLRRVERPLGLVHPRQAGPEPAVRPGVRPHDLPGHAQGGLQRLQDAQLPRPEAPDVGRRHRQRRRRRDGDDVREQRRAPDPRLRHLRRRSTPPAPTW